MSGNVRIRITCCICRKKAGGPDEYAEHLASGRELKEAEHHGSANALDIQLRGEYIYIADGEAGFGGVKWRPLSGGIAALHSAWRV